MAARSRDSCRANITREPRQTKGSRLDAVRDAPYKRPGAKRYWNAQHAYASGSNVPTVPYGVHFQKLPNMRSREALSASCTRHALLRKRNDEQIETLYLHNFQQCPQKHLLTPLRCCVHDKHNHQLPPIPSKANLQDFVRVNSTTDDEKGMDDTFDGSQPH